MAGTEQTPWDEALRRERIELRDAQMEVRGMQDDLCRRVAEHDKWLRRLQEGQEHALTAIARIDEITRQELIPQIRNLTSAIHSLAEEQKQVKLLFHSMLETQALLQQANVELRRDHDHDMSRHEKETSLLTKAGVGAGALGLGAAGLWLLEKLISRGSP